MDRRTALAAADFSTVRVELAIGNDVGVGEVHLVEHPAGSGRWRMA